MASTHSLRLVRVLTGTTFAPLRVGSFTADGQGHITGGVEDVNAEGQVTNAVAITGGTYTVHADGRGFMNLIFGQSSIDFQDRAHFYQ
jgi:hypothetical protein